MMATNATAMKHFKFVKYIEICRVSNQDYGLRGDKVAAPWSWLLLVKARTNVWYILCAQLSVISGMCARLILLRCSQMTEPGGRLFQKITTVILRERLRAHLSSASQSSRDACLMVHKTYRAFPLFSLRFTVNAHCSSACGRKV